MHRTAFTFLLLLLVIGCGKQDDRNQRPTIPGGPPAQPDPPGRQPGGQGGQQEEKISLTEARKGHVPKPVSRGEDREPVDEPPPKIFRKVKYDSPVGKLSAYLSPDPKDGKKHPAIIWITGGDCNSIGDVWGPTKPTSDESAQQYRQAGIVMMFPSLRGGNDNPGKREGFFGEVDDVLAAADFLAKQEYVDPAHIYLGGHSTGGTLVMLVAASSDRFRAVFSFGPADDVSHYPPQYAPFDQANREEVELRSPGRWLHSIQSPTFVIEGTRGNFASLQTMKRNSRNPLVQFLAIQGGDHFGILAATNRLLARKILQDNGATSNLTLTEAEVNNPGGR
jgi:alpha/beta superfamily hydrolase